MTAAIDNASIGTINLRGWYEPSSASDYNLGQTIGDVASIIGGIGETTAGVAAAGGGAVAVAGSGGTAALAVAPASSGVGAMIAHGVGVAGSGASSLLMQRGRVSGSGEPSQLAAGKKAHADDPVRPGEQAEVRTPSGKRMDRYNPESNTIREIKPNNARGVKAGNKQLEQYKKEMDAKTGKKHNTELTTYDPKQYKE